MEETEIKQVKETSPLKLLRITAVIIFIFAIIVVIFLKYDNPELNVWWMILILGGTLGIALILWFLFNIKELLSGAVNDEAEKAKLKLPEPLNEDEWQTRLKLIMKNPMYTNEITGFKKHRILSIGQEAKESILEVNIETLYDKESDCWIIMNLNYPQRFNVLIDPSIAERSRTINASSSHPEDTPNVEVTETYNPFTQTAQKTRKESKADKAKKELKKDGDFK